VPRHNSQSIQTGAESRRSAFVPKKKKKEKAWIRRPAFVHRKKLNKKKDKIPNPETSFRSQEKTGKSFRSQGKKTE
jgi:hypothetical protein